MKDGVVQVGHAGEEMWKQGNAGGMIDDDRAGCDQNQIQHIGQFQTGKATQVVSAQRRSLSCGEMAPCERQCQDEPADHEEELNSAIAETERAYRQCERGVDRKRITVVKLTLKMEEQDGEDGDEAQAIDLGQPGAGGGPTAKMIDPGYSSACGHRM